MSTLNEITNLSPEVFSFLFSLIIKGFVILTLAGGLNIYLKSASAATKHLVWLLGFAAVGLLPILLFTIPIVDIPVLSAKPVFSQAEVLTDETAEYIQPIAETTNEYSTIPIVPSQQTPHESIPAMEPELDYSACQYMLMIWAMGLIITLLPIITRLISLIVFQAKCKPINDSTLQGYINGSHPE